MFCFKHLRPPINLFNASLDWLETWLLQHGRGLQYVWNGEQYRLEKI